MFRHILGLLLVAVCLVQVVVSCDHNGWQEPEEENHVNQYVPSDLGGARQQLATFFETELIKKVQDQSSDSSSDDIETRYD